MRHKRDAYEELMGNKHGMLSVIDRPEKAELEMYGYTKE